MRRTTLAPVLVLTLAALATGAALGARTASPTSGFSGSLSTGSSTGGSTSGFSGSGTTGGGGGEDGGGSDDSGLGEGGGDGGGFLQTSLPVSGVSGLSVATVRKLQSDLARLGYFHHVVTGFYGSVTASAVKQFQRASGLKADGIWGPHSQSALTRRLARG